LENAIEAVNKGADAYILKPFDMDNVLNKIREHLKKQQEAKKYSQEKVRVHRNTRQRTRRGENCISQKTTLKSFFIYVPKA